MIRGFGNLHSVTSKRRSLKEESRVRNSSEIKREIPFCRSVCMRKRSETYTYTRMHSSRMCTAHNSSHRGGSASVHAGIHPPGCGPGDPLDVGLETPPQVWAWRPLGQTSQLPPWVWAWNPLSQNLNFPPGCGSGNLQGMLGYHPPRDLLQGMLGYHLQCMLGYHPPSPVNRMTDRNV